VSTPGAAATHPDARVRRVVDFYETLGPAALPRLAELYASDARFIDPFNDVQGTAAIERIFRHMFSQLQQPRFVVHSAAVQDDAAFLTWDFLFRRGAQDMRIHGATRLLFNPQGRVQLHRDYWDAAHELYEQLPLLGALMRWLRRRLAA
jgi:steroid Delta-isomerase